MPNPQIIDYVAKARSAGLPEAQIRMSLTDAGWPVQDIDEAFSPVAAKSSSPTAGAVAQRKPLPIKAIVITAIVAALGVAGYFAFLEFDLSKTIVEPVTTAVKGTWEKVASAFPFMGSNDKPVPTATPQPVASATPAPTPTPEPVVTEVEKAGFEKFASEEAFKEYLAASQQNSGYGGGVSFMSAGRGIAEGMPAPVPMMKNDSAGNIASPPMIGGSDPQRISDTNVQVKGVDEPDIVKTDGSSIYYARMNAFGPYAVPMRAVESTPEPSEPMLQQVGETMIAPDAIGIGIMPPQKRAQQETSVIKAFPPGDMAKQSAIDAYGNLLVAGKTLIVLPSFQQYMYYGYRGTEKSAIRGYDVMNPTEPKELWSVELKDATTLQDARLLNGTLYLITRTSVSYDKPCPIVPMVMGAKELSIPCMDVYHPVGNVPVDVTFTVLAVNPKDGSVTKNVSFVAPSAQSILFMSASALYVTYPLQPDVVAVVYGFFSQSGKDLIPASLLARIEKLRGYDISNASKISELTMALEKHMASLGSDERLRIENEMSNRSKTYFSEHARELSKTGIIKISASDLTVAASGEVPGTLLNQFSMDEYQGNLRLASTIDGQNMWGFGFGGRTESVSDVYVLDDKLAVIGSVTGLGITERIYAARFVENKGYVVTFRQTDPFYVIDLSDPKNPRMTGELKIPGFSSYLHPLAKDRILGVGRENSQVKLSLFDVSDPSKPVEKAKYALSEYWTEVQNTHHAFLQDEKHKVFFMPGSKGGYVFSYDGDQLKLTATLANSQVTRALYLDDYMYLIGQNSITVFNERDWQKMKELDL